MSQHKTTRNNCPWVAETVHPVSANIVGRKYSQWSLQLGKILVDLPPSMSSS